MSRGQALRLLIAHELRSIARDRRMIMLSVLLPLLVLPLVLLGQQAIKRNKDKADEQRSYAYAIVSTEQDEQQWLQSLVDTGLAATEEGKRPHLEARSVEDPLAALADGELAVVLSVTEGEESERAVKIQFQGDRETSRKGSDAVEDVLEAARTEERAQSLDRVDFPVELSQVLPIETHDAAERGHTKGASLGRMLMPIIVFLIVVGGQVAAADTLAGEKERGTLETLLTTAARREDIVQAKLVSILVVALSITGINVGNLLLYVTLGVLPGAEDLSASLPVGAIVVLLLLLIPVALVISGFLLLLSGHARSFKEAQLFAFPLQLGLLVPAAASFMPGLSLRSAIALVPVANASVATREVLSGQFDGLMLAVVVLVNLGAGAWLARAATRTLREERLISPASLDSAELEGGRVAFERHVWRWALGAWAVFLLISLNLPTLDLRLQIVINLIIIMLGTAILVARRYRLDVRRVWSLRRPPSIAWLAVALGVPSGFMVAHGVLWLSGFVFPVPEETLRSFGDTLMPDSIPQWQLLTMMTIVPGICEEIFFRGMLLHGLRRRLSPLVLCLVVGLFFGFFHVSLFRILPTGFLGVLFAATTLWTGSIIPAMVWHALNNLLAVSLGMASIEPPMWSLAVAVPMLACALWLLWRARVPEEPEDDAGERP